MWGIPNFDPFLGASQCLSTLKGRANKHCCCRENIKLKNAKLRSVIAFVVVLFLGAMGRRYQLRFCWIPNCCYNCHQAAVTAAVADAPPKSAGLHWWIVITMHGR